MSYETMEGKRISVIKMVGGNLTVYSDEARELVEQLLETGEFWEYISVVLEENFKSRSQVSKITEEITSLREEFTKTQSAVTVTSSSTMERNMENMLKMMLTMKQQVDGLTKLPSSQRDSAYPGLSLTSSDSYEPAEIVEVEIVEKKASAFGGGLSGLASKFKTGNKK